MEELVSDSRNTEESQSKAWCTDSTALSKPSNAPTHTTDSLLLATTNTPSCDNKLRDTEAALTHVYNTRYPRPKNFERKKRLFDQQPLQDSPPDSVHLQCRQVNYGEVESSVGGVDLMTLRSKPYIFVDLLGYQFDVGQCSIIFKMEVCVDSVVSAVNASRGGASRLELCVALSEGGLTPTPGLLEIVKSCVHIPVFVMLRPRPGADFVYSPEEARIIKCDAAVLKKHGADGFVFGALTASGLIDEILCKDIVEIVAPLPVTFHRAIDVVRNPVGSMETIIQLGFTRILTSGGERTAYAGLQIIRELMVASMGRITIVPASGINSDNLGPILEVTGAREFHVSGRVPLKISWNQSKCKMGTGDDDTIYVTSYDVVARFSRVQHDKRIFSKTALVVLCHLEPGTSASRPPRLHLFTLELDQTANGEGRGKVGPGKMY
uniref:Copper homeostasis protein cutC homolog n=1 Tax=Timema douglasi TaxID=61478 RepID=A0A7R8VNP8_TIMDO|nr:unnamed protein product [Timema douglasi]